MYNVHRVSIYTHTHLFLGLQGCSSRDDLNQLGGDASLSGAVVLQSELADHLTRVLGGVLHRGHAGGLLRGGVLHQGVVDLGGQRVFIEVSQRLRLRVRLHIVLALEEFHVGVHQRGDGLDGGDVGYRGLESVVHDVHSGVLPRHYLLRHGRGQTPGVGGLALREVAHDQVAVRALEQGAALLTLDEQLVWFIQFSQHLSSLTSQY